MGKEKKKDKGLPVYYDTLNLLSDSEIEKIESMNPPTKFPRVHIERFKSESFMVVNYHKHISRVFDDKIFSRKDK